MRHNRVVGAFVLTIIIVVIAALWTMRETEPSLDDETSQTVNRSRAVDEELFEEF